MDKNSECRNLFYAYKMLGDKIKTIGCIFQNGVINITEQDFLDFHSDIKQTKKEFETLMNDSIRFLGEI